MSEELPKKFRVGRSNTGLGLFATSPISKRETIAEYLGLILNFEEAEKKSNSQYLFEISKHRTIDGSPRWNLARYANYSCDPNAESVNRKGRIFMVAIKNIAVGEEITYDYGEEFFKQHILKKGCRCKVCEIKNKKRKNIVEKKNKKIIEKFFRKVIHMYLYKSY